MYLKFLLLQMILFCTLPLRGEAQLPQPVFEKTLIDSSEKFQKCTHSINQHGTVLEYESVVGSLAIKSSTESPGKDKAEVFFTAYFVKNPLILTGNRPITFCFNGGPGSSSVWLHMGILGPKKTQTIDLAFTPSPGTYENNPYTLLPSTDLVFVDPVSTGFSRAADGVNEKEFHGVEEDIEYLAEFIRLFLTRFDRFDSPRYLLGESYGTIRVIGLAQKLHKDYFVDVNGLILISSTLDLMTWTPYDTTNDLSYALVLPSYAATAWYHKKLPVENNSKKLQELLAEVEDFAINEYAPYLLQGDKLEQEKKIAIAKRLASYIGIPEEEIMNSHIRIPITRFITQLETKDRKLLGRFDSRFLGPKLPCTPDYITYDPSFEAITGAFTSTFLKYLQTELHCTKDSRYYLLNSNVNPWNWSLKSQPPGLGCLNMTEDLRDTLIGNPAMRVFIASGYYDLALPTLLLTIH